MGEGYQLLQIESEQSPSPRPTRQYCVGGALAFSTLVVLVVILTVSLTPHTSASSHNLEIRPDNTPASKRGAGLLLTYVSHVIPAQMAVTFKRALKCCLEVLLQCVTVSYRDTLFKALHGLQIWERGAPATAKQQAQQQYLGFARRKCGGRGHKPTCNSKARGSGGNGKCARCCFREPDLDQVGYDMLCCAVMCLCYAMPCHAMPCHAMPCHAMPCKLQRCQDCQKLFWGNHWASLMPLHVIRLCAKHICP